MNKIQYVSLFFRIIFQFLFIALPIELALSWLYAPKPLSFLGNIFKLSAIPSNYAGLHFYSKTGLYENAIMHTLNATEKCLGFIASGIPLAIELFILYSLIKLFKMYEKGNIFSINHVKYIRNIGYALLTGELINPFYQFLMGLILTWRNPPGHGFASVTLDQTNIGILLTALLVILISWIMAEGYKLREEQQLTI